MKFGLKVNALFTRGPTLGALGVSCTFAGAKPETLTPGGSRDGPRSNEVKIGKLVVSVIVVFPTVVVVVLVPVPVCCKTRTLTGVSGGKKLSGGPRSWVRWRIVPF
jgi:hypothetical protein